MTNASTPSGLDLLRIPNVQGWNDDNPGLQHDNSYVAKLEPYVIGRGSARSS